MKTLILICALGVPRADCSIDTAMTVVQGPDAGHPAQCGFLGQAYLASTAIANYLDGEHYLKILCTAGEPIEVRTAPADDAKQIADALR